MKAFKESLLPHVMNVNVDFCDRTSASRLCDALPLIMENARTRSLIVGFRFLFVRVASEKAESPESLEKKAPFCVEPRVLCFGLLFPYSSVSSRLRNERRGGQTAQRRANSHCRICLSHLFVASVEKICDTAQLWS